MNFQYSNEPNSGLKREGIVNSIEARLTFQLNLIADNGKIASTSSQKVIHLPGAKMGMPEPANLTPEQKNIFAAEQVAREKIANALIELEAVYTANQPAEKV